MKFSIKILDSDQEDIFGETCLWSEICIETFKEKFATPVDYWNKEDYVSQWHIAINDLIRGASKGYLVAAMRDPKISEFVSVYSRVQE